MSGAVPFRIGWIGCGNHAAEMLLPQLLRHPVRLALPGKPGLRVVYHAVPDLLGANRERAEAFAAAWNRHVSPGRLLYYKDPRAQAILELERGADPFEATTQLRTLWD